MFAERTLPSSANRSLQPNKLYASSNLADSTNLTNATNYATVRKPYASSAASKSSYSQRPTEDTTAPTRQRPRESDVPSDQDRRTTRTSRYTENYANRSPEKPREVPKPATTLTALLGRDQRSREAPKQGPETRPRSPEEQIPTKTEKPRPMPPPVAPKPPQLAARAAKYLTIGATPSRRDRTPEASAEKSADRLNSNATKSILRIPPDVEHERITRRESSEEHSPHRHAHAEYLRESVLYTKVKMPPLDLPLSGNRHLLRGNYANNGDPSWIGFYLPSPPDPPEPESGVHSAQPVQIVSRSPSPPPRAPVAAVSASNTATLRRKQVGEYETRQPAHIQPRSPSPPPRVPVAANGTSTLRRKQQVEVRLASRSPSPLRRAERDAEVPSTTTTSRRRDKTDHGASQIKQDYPAPPVTAGVYRGGATLTDRMRNPYSERPQTSTPSVSSYIRPYVRSVPPKKPHFSDDEQLDEIFLIPPPVPPPEATQAPLRAKSRTPLQTTEDARPRPHSATFTRNQLTAYYDADDSLPHFDVPSAAFPPPPDPTYLAQYAPSRTAMPPMFFGQPHELETRSNASSALQYDSSGDEAKYRERGSRTHKTTHRTSHEHPPVTTRPQPVAVTKEAIAEHDRIMAKAAAKASKTYQQNGLPLREVPRPRSRLSSGASSAGESVASSRGRLPNNYIATTRPLRIVNEEAIGKDGVPFVRQNSQRVSIHAQSRKIPQVPVEPLQRKRVRPPSSYAGSDISERNSIPVIEPEPEPEPTTLYGYWGEEGPSPAARMARAEFAQLILPEEQCLRRHEVIQARDHELNAGHESDASLESIGIPEALSEYADYKKILQDAIDETADPEEPVQLKGYWGDAQPAKPASPVTGRRHFSRYFADSPDVQLSNPFRLLERQTFSRSPPGLSDSGHSDEESARSSPVLPSQVAQKRWPNGHGHHFNGVPAGGNSNAANHSDGEVRYHPSKPKIKKKSFVRRISEFMRGGLKVKPNSAVAEGLRRLPSIRKKDPSKDTRATRDKSPLSRYQDQPLSKPSARNTSESRVASRIHPPQSVTPPATRDSGISDMTGESLAFYDLPGSVYAKSAKQSNLSQRWRSEFTLNKPSPALRASIRFKEPPESLKPSKSNENLFESIRKKKGKQFSGGPLEERLNMQVSKIELNRYDHHELRRPSVANPVYEQNSIGRSTGSHYKSSPQLAVIGKSDARNRRSPDTPDSQPTATGSTGSTLSEFRSIDYDPPRFVISSREDLADVLPKRITRPEASTTRTRERDTSHHRTRQPSVALSISSRGESSVISRTDSPDSSVYGPYRLTERPRVVQEARVRSKPRSSFDDEPVLTSVKPPPRVAKSSIDSGNSRGRPTPVQPHKTPEMPRKIPREVRPVERFSPARDRRTPKYTEKPATLSRSTAAPTLTALRIAGACVLSSSDRQRHGRSRLQNPQRRS